MELQDTTAFEPVTPPTEKDREQALAWLGDAVLGLWARQRILKLRGTIHTQDFLNLTSNQFLLSLGRPTKVEAEIGLVYEQDGLETACRYIEQRLLPVYERQEAKRRRAQPRG